MDKKKIIRYFHDNLQFNVHKFITIYYNLEFIKIIFNIIQSSQILNLYLILATPRNNSPPSSPVPRIKVSSEEQKLHDTSNDTLNTI